MILVVDKFNDILGSESFDRERSISTCSCESAGMRGSTRRYTSSS